MGDLSQMWVGGAADSQTRSKPLKILPNHPEYRIFLPKFQLLFSQISQNPGVGGWVGKQIWERSPKKTVFFTPSLKIQVKLGYIGLLYWFGGRNM